ncbi:hypothetical protein HY493_04420 [Candidatus Woesearchaeota archaeon]|nr:hypothetical protein [Candidatus Woesearchaeota archaeon]
MVNPQNRKAEPSRSEEATDYVLDASENAADHIIGSSRQNVNRFLEPARFQEAIACVTNWLDTRRFANRGHEKADKDPVLTIWDAYLNEYEPIVKDVRHYGGCDIDKDQGISTKIQRLIDSGNGAAYAASRWQRFVTGRKRSIGTALLVASIGYDILEDPDRISVQQRFALERELTGARSVGSITPDQQATFKKELPDLVVGALLAEPAKYFAQQETHRHPVLRAVSRPVPQRSLAERASDFLSSKCFKHPVTTVAKKCWDEMPPIEAIRERFSEMYVGIPVFAVAHQLYREATR